MSTDVDARLESQLARRAELDTLKAVCDGLGEQIADTQHKLEAVRALQASLTPLVSQVDTLQTAITAHEGRLGAMTFTEATAVEQEKRYAELVSASRIIVAEVAERSRQMQTLGEQMGLATTMKNEMLAELDRVASRHRETVGHIHASEDQLTRAESLYKQLEQRRLQLALSEQKLAKVESRLADATTLATELDKSAAAIATREQLVHAVKAEVESVHEISARSRADLAHVADQRGEVAALRAQVDLLLSRIAETGDRMAAIEAQRNVVDEVETKANTIVHLLDDVRINLETLGEQKAVVDHVAEQVAQLESMLQEGRNTVRALQHERELAARIETGIKQLRSRTGAQKARDLAQAG